MFLVAMEFLRGSIVSYPVICTPSPFACFCASHRQHINLVLTYLLLVRLLTLMFITWHTIWKRCDDGYIFRPSVLAGISISTHSTCTCHRMLEMCAHKRLDRPLTRLRLCISYPPIDFHGLFSLVDFLVASYRITEHIPVHRRNELR